MLSIVPIEVHALTSGFRDLVRRGRVDFPAVISIWLRIMPASIVPVRIMIWMQLRFVPCLHPSLFFDDLDHLPRGVQCRVQNENSGPEQFWSIRCASPSVSQHTIMVLDGLTSCSALICWLLFTSKLLICNEDEWWCYVVDSEIHS